MFLYFFDLCVTYGERDKNILIGSTITIPDKSSKDTQN